MIKIKRPQAPPFLTDPKGIWYKETQDAIAHYQSGVPESFEFKHYNNAKLKDELKKVFIKCAYCESVYDAVYDGDVEHFRPKGRIMEKNPPTPGYYWLANDWDNLFLACQHCNQRRKHILFGDDDLKGYGKLDQFPLDPEAKRWISHSIPLKDEEDARLLVNPCKDDPQAHFAYEKEHGVIVPLTKMGEISIAVYVLQRPCLVQERKKKLIKLFQCMEIVKLSLESMNKNKDPDTKRVFKSALNALMDFTTDGEPYAGMCRFFVRGFLRENNI